MPSKLQFTGFAYCLKIRRRHIFLEIQARLGEDVIFVEDTNDRETPVEKARVPHRYWTEPPPSGAAHFNQRIKDHPDLKTCLKIRLVRGKCLPIDLLLVSELLVLAWSVEPWTKDPVKAPVIMNLPQALDAWLEMPPEEHRTLYRHTNRPRHCKRLAPRPPLRPLRQCRRRTHLPAIPQRKKSRMNATNEAQLEFFTEEKPQ